MSSLKQDIPKVLDFFDLDSRGKAEQFSSILRFSMQLADKIKEKLVYGKEEEKQEIFELIEDLKNKVKQETKKICTDLGLSEEDLFFFMNNPNNFSEEEWNIMKEAKDFVEKEGYSLPQEKKTSPKKRKKRSKKSQWIQS